MRNGSLAEFEEFATADTLGGPVRRAGDECDANVRWRMVQRVAAARLGRALQPDAGVAVEIYGGRCLFWEREGIRARLDSFFVAHSQSRGATEVIKRLLRSADATPTARTTLRAPRAHGPRPWTHTRVLHTLHLSLRPVPLTPTRKNLVAERGVCLRACVCSDSPF